MSTATDLIKNFLNSADTNDYQQQEIGVPSTALHGGITIAMIKRSIDSPTPTDEHDWDMWGLDQGTTEHWICRIRYRYPDTSVSGISPQMVYERSHREVITMRSCREDEIAGLVEGCDGGALDNEPGREWADSIARSLPGTVLFDQRGERELYGLIQKEIQVEVGGRKIPAIACDTHRIQSAILALFVGTDDRTEGSRITLPSWVNPGDLGDRSPTRHLTTSTRDPKTGKWARPNDSKDDLLKALLGCELRYYLEICGGMPKNNGINASNIKSYRDD